MHLLFIITPQLPRNPITARIVPIIMKTIGKCSCSIKNSSAASLNIDENKAPIVIKPTPFSC